MNRFTVNFGAAKRIYSGGDHACRCGCKGTYADKGTKAFTVRMNKIKAINPSLIVGITVDPDYVNISLADNKALTVYFN